VKPQCRCHPLENNLKMGREKKKYFHKKIEKKLDNPLSLVRMRRVIENGT